MPLLGATRIHSPPSRLYCARSTEELASRAVKEAERWLFICPVPAWREDPRQRAACCPLQIARSLFPPSARRPADSRARRRPRFSGNTRRPQALSCRRNRTFGLICPSKASTLFRFLRESRRNIAIHLRCRRERSKAPFDIPFAQPLAAAARIGSWMSFA